MLSLKLILRLIRALFRHVPSALFAFFQRVYRFLVLCKPPTSPGDKENAVNYDCGQGTESQSPSFVAGSVVPPPHAPSGIGTGQAPLNLPPNAVAGENSPYEMSKHIPGLVAITTKVEYERYDRTQTHNKFPNPQYEVPSFQLSFSGPDPPESWSTFVHPEGVRYFRNLDAFAPVLTEAWIYDDQVRVRIEGYMESISTYVRDNAIALPSGTCLVLELRQSGRCGYYFVNHRDKCLFWLDPFDFSALLGPLEIPHITSHFALLMQSHYWYHNELFPHVYRIEDEALDDITDIIVYSIGDLLTAGENSLVSFNLKTLRVSLDLVQHHQEQGDKRSSYPGGARFVYRVASYLYYDRFLNLFGERIVRLNAYQSIYPPCKNSWIIKFISPLMMFGPEGHLGRLRNTTVDYMVSNRLWDSFAEKTFGEWRETILYATVLLNSNVAFLAIQSVDAQGNRERQSDSQRASYFSVITSLGSIIFGLLMLRQHRGVITSQLIANRSASNFGLETLAILFSLPYTLLMWSMLAFLLAFFLQWYHSRDFVVIGQTTAVAGIYLACIIWSVAVAAENEGVESEEADEDNGFLQDVRNLWSRVSGDDHESQ